MMISMNATDIYLPDETTGELKQVISRWKMMIGEYRDETGKVIRSVKDIKGVVYDRNGNPLFREEDIPKLVDSKGRKFSKSYIVRRSRVAGAGLKMLWNAHAKPIAWMARKFFGTKRRMDEEDEQQDTLPQSKGSVFTKGKNRLMKGLGAVAGVFKPKGKDTEDTSTSFTSNAYGGRVKTIDGVVIDPRTGKARANNYKEEMKRQDDTTKERERLSKERIDKEHAKKSEKDKSGVWGALAKFIPMITGAIGILTGKLKDLAGWIVGGVSNALWGGLKWLGKGAWKLGAWMVKGIGSLMSGAWDLLSKSKLGKGIGKSIGSVLNKGKDLVKKGASKVTRGASAVTKSVAGKVATAKAKTVIAKKATKSALVAGGKWAATKVAGRAVLGALGPIGVGILALWTTWEIGSFIWDMFSSPNKVDDFRLSAYGVNPENEKRASVMMKFEDYITKRAKVDESGTLIFPNLDFKEKEMSKILAGFIGGDDGMERLGQMSEEEQAEYVENWETWYDARFKPVYAAHANALRAIDSKMKLTDAFGLTGDLENGLVFPWMRNAYFKPEVENNPYDLLVDPFLYIEDDEDVPGLADKDMVKHYYDIVAKAYAKDEQSLRTKDENRKKINERSGKEYKSVFAFETKDNPVKEEDTKSKTIPALESNHIQKVLQDSSAGLVLNNAMLFSSKFALGLPSSLTFDPTKPIDDLIAARIKLYGLNELAESKVMVLLQLEQALVNEIVYETNGNTRYKSGDIVTNVVRTTANKLGWNVNDPNDLAKFKLWFDHRFTPVFLTFASQVYQKTKSKDILVTVDRLLANDKFNILTILSSLKVNINGLEYEIWNVPFGLIKDVQANKDPGTISKNLTNLENNRVERIIPEKDTVAKQDTNPSTPSSSVTQAISGLQNAISSNPLYNGTGGENPDLYKETVRGMEQGASTAVQAVTTDGKINDPYSGAAKNAKQDKRVLAKTILEEIDKLGWSETEKNHFLAQITHESGGLKWLRELGNKQYFANKKYGDKWKGRGLIHLTWDYNYKAFAKAINRPDILQNPDLVATDPELTVKSAIWWWENKKRERKDFAKAVNDPNGGKVVSYRVNGGYRHLNERLKQLAIYSKGGGVIRELAGKAGEVKQGGLGDGSTNVDNNSKLIEGNSAPSMGPEGVSDLGTSKEHDKPVAGTTTVPTVTGESSGVLPFNDVQTQYTAINAPKPNEVTKTELEKGDASKLSGKSDNLQQTLQMVDPKLVKVGEENLKPMTSKVNLKGMNQNFMKLLYTAVGEYVSKGGKMNGITSAFRTAEEQAALRKKLGNDAAKVSRHQSGLAIDINNGKQFDGKSGFNDKFFNSGIPEKYGFVRNLMYKKNGQIWEPWHVENKYFPNANKPADNKEYTPDSASEVESLTTKKPEVNTTPVTPSTPVLANVPNVVNNSYAGTTNLDNAVNAATPTVESPSSYITPNIAPVQTVANNQATQLETQQQKIIEANKESYDAMINILRQQVEIQKTTSDDIRKIVDHILAKPAELSPAEKRSEYQHKQSEPSIRSSIGSQVNGTTPSPMIGFGIGNNRLVI